MGNRARITVAVLAAMLVMAGTAEAGKRLSISKAASASEADAAYSCDYYAECVGYSSGPCSRLSARRVACDQVFLYQMESGNSYRCDQTNIWQKRGKRGVVVESRGDVECVPVE